MFDGAAVGGAGPQPLGEDGVHHSPPGPLVPQLLPIPGLEISIKLNKIINHVMEGGGLHQENKTSRNAHFLILGRDIFVRRFVT